METIIRFPEAKRRARRGKMMADKSRSATVVILPVVRIERYTDKPPLPRSKVGSGRSHRRRRSRASGG
jgi:hypothetical protein